jgi:hypothetical protein
MLVLQHARVDNNLFKLQGTILSNLDTFERICHEQSVDLQIDLRDPALTSMGFVPGNYTPTPVLAAISHAGHALRKNPGLALVSKPIRPIRPLVQDLGTSTLLDVVNHSLEPIEPDETVFSLETSDVMDIDACPEAESSFTKAIAGLKKPHKVDFLQGSQILLDEQERPLFIRKSHGIVSALSLQPYIVNGVRFPAGSITRVDTISDFIEVDGVRYPSTAGFVDNINVVPHDQIQGVAFKRLSAFAFPPGERSIFRQSLIEAANPKERRMIKWLSLDAINELAINRAQEILKAS